MNLKEINVLLVSLWYLEDFGYYGMLFGLFEYSGDCLKRS